MLAFGGVPYIYIYIHTYHGFFKDHSLSTPGYKDIAAASYSKGFPVASVWAPNLTLIHTNLFTIYNIETHKTGPTTIKGAHNKGQ